MKASQVQSSNLAPYFNFRLLRREELAFYEENGYLLIDEILTPQGLEIMVSEAMNAWRSEKGDFDPGHTWLENALLPNIHHHSKMVRDYYFEGPLVDIAGQIIGPDLKGVTSQLTFKMRGNDKPFHWHQDNGYGELDPYNAISCLTSFDAADRSNGCLWIIPGSHKQGRLHAGLSMEEKKSRLTIQDDPDESEAVPMAMKPGQCLIFNCWMLHKSDGNFSQDRDRRVLFLRYADADAVEVYNNRNPRLGRLLRGNSRFTEVSAYENDL